MRLQAPLASCPVNFADCLPAADMTAREDAMGWDAEARRLRAQGHDTGEIATKLGQAPEVSARLCAGSPSGGVGRLRRGADARRAAHAARSSCDADRQALPSAAADCAAARSTAQN